MDRRTIYLMIAASWIFIIFLMFNPPKPKQDPKKQGKNDVQETDANGESPKDSKPDDAQDKDPTKQDPAKKKNANSSSKADEPPGKNNSGKQPVNQDPDKTPDQDVAKPDSKSEPKNPIGDDSPGGRVLAQKFISLGSLAVDSPYRFLVTFNNRAASVHRLELVQRHRNSEKLKYKDLEIRYGYLGHLNLANVESGGCRVQNVGSKTPADIAGIKVDDEITQFDGKSIESESDFLDLLKETQPGQEITITTKRGGGEQTVNVTLMQQPLEVIRPNIVPDQATFAFEQIKNRSSFSISLFHPVVGRDWDPVGQAETDVWESETGEDWIKFYYPYKDEKEVKESKSEVQIIKTFRF